MALVRFYPPPARSRARRGGSLALNPAIVTMDAPEPFDPSEFDINRPWENFRQKLLDAENRAGIDRGQFGLAHTQGRSPQNA